MVEPEEDCRDTASNSTRSGGCTTCAPVLETCKHAFQLLIRQGAELRHCKSVLPNPKKPDVQHYRNRVKQNAWIRSNLFDALGNYKYCSACIISILGIGSQRLLHQRRIKQREAHIPIVDMSKSSIANERLEEYVVMHPEADNFKKWWDTLADTELVKVRYPYDQHGLARKPTNSEKRTMREHFFDFVDKNSQPTGRNDGSFGARYYFSPNFTRIGEPKQSEKNLEFKMSHSLLCEFSRTQREHGRDMCSERSVFRWLKEYRPKHAISPHQTDYCDRCKRMNEEISRQKTTLQRLRHTGDCESERLHEHEALMKQAEAILANHKDEAQEALEHYKFTVQQCKREWSAIIELASHNDLDHTVQMRLQALKDSFSLVLSSDYQMTKLIPFWGETAQPGITYYLRKVSHDLFGIVDHRNETIYIRYLMSV